MAQRERLFFLVRHGEIGTKGENRPAFERQLRRNIEGALKGLHIGEVRKEAGGILIEVPPETPAERVQERLRHVFGIQFFAPVRLVPNEVEAMQRVAVEMMLRHREEEPYESFRVTARRVHKQFPLTSQDLNRVVGAAIQQATGVRVDLENPDAVCYLEVRWDGTLIYSRRFPGQGGLPVGISERGVALLSAGIDSPVAAWRMMRRGMEVVFVHFHSYPQTNRASQENALELAKVLTRYQLFSILYFVPLLEIQRHVVANAPPHSWVLLYRRAMLRLADRIAEMEGAPVLITGESVGQVASQTPSNLRAVSEAASRPILRPLISFDKAEIVAQAKEIGTYDISIQPYEDCCSLFVPRHPLTRAEPETLRRLEAELQWEPLLEKALGERERYVIEFQGTEGNMEEGIAVERVQPWGG